MDNQNNSDKEEEKPKNKREEKQLDKRERAIERAQNGALDKYKNDIKVSITEENIRGQIAKVKAQKRKGDVESEEDSELASD